MEAKNEVSETVVEKDTVIHVTKEEEITRSKEEEATKPEHDENDQMSAVGPDGEIDWDCPCLQGATEGPCGEGFKTAFQCFVYSKEEPKGTDCLEEFKAMHECMMAHPEYYNDDDDEDKKESDSESDSDTDTDTDTEQEEKA